MPRSKKYFVELRTFVLVLHLHPTDNNGKMRLKDMIGVALQGTPIFDDTESCCQYYCI